MKASLGCLLTLLLTACAATATPPPVTSTPQVISVYATTAAEPWLDHVYQCAGQQSVLVRLSASESAADVRLRLGEPKNLTTPAYQIASEDLLIVTHRESPLQNLNSDQARALFSRGQEGIQVWVYASGEDVQQAFEREIMRGAGITSLARLAAHPQQILDALNSDPNSVGLLTGHWKAGSIREIYTIPNLPVLAIPAETAQGAVKELLACLQK